MIFRIYDSKRMDMYIQTIRQNQLARFRNVSWHVYIIYLFIPCRCRRGYIFTRYCRTLSNVSQITWTGFFSIVNICITNTRNGSIFDNDTGDCWGIYLWALNFLLLIWLITSMTYKSLKLSNLTRIELDQSPSPLSQAFKTWTWTSNVCTQINSYASFCHSFCLNWHKTNSKN